MIDKSFCFCLKIILWKNDKIRRHHFIFTILEIVMPVFLFIMVTLQPVWLAAKMKREYSAEKEGELCDSKKLKLMSYFILYYAPEDQFTSMLISNVASKLNFKGYGGNNGTMVQGFKSEHKLIKCYQDYVSAEEGSWRYPVLAVVFINTNKGLKYTIRRSPAFEGEMWDTVSLFQNLNPFSMDRGVESYMYEMMALQMALDTSYLEMLTKNEPVSFTIQQFRYPAQISDGGRQSLYRKWMPMITAIGFLFTFLFVLQRVMDEKISGIKELMKIMGLKSWMLWLGWLLYSLPANFISIILITVVMNANVFGEGPVLIYCSPSVFGVYLLLYCINLTTFAFFMSSLFNKPMFANIFGLIISCVGSYVEYPDHWKLSLKIILAFLFPSTLLKQGYAEFFNYETQKIGSHWNNIFTSGLYNSNDITLGLVFIIYMLSSIWFMVITMYMENVKPGPYGVAKPLHFPVLYLQNIRNRKVRDEEAPDFENTAKIEKPPNLRAGIVLKNLCKRFGKENVVNNFSIAFYEGQITVLLGHNGAGKTTTMSIITGMISANSGKVIINDQDITYNMDKVRSSLGYCPQTNMYFRDLNVNEHLLFFAMLKGLSYKSAVRESKEILQKMSLTRKADTSPSKLSGGMKRRLSLCMAICGDSKVLILDEPTSGLDPETRREIWDILLSFRGSRTVIITTHFMEEADVLGDRIAIMNHGKLMCYGTPMYLKKEYGSGYTLTLVRDNEGYRKRNPQGPDHVEALTKIVQGKIKSATILTASGNRVIFVLPHDTKPSFGETLGAVESMKEELFVTNIALSITTMEEVFLSVDTTVGEGANRSGNPMANGNMSFVRNATKKRKGLRLIIMQIWSLLKKRFLVFIRNWMVYVLAVLVALSTSILSVYVRTVGEEKSSSASGGSFTYDLHRYEKSVVYYRTQNNDSFWKNVTGHYKKLILSQGSTAVQVPSVSDEVVSKGRENIIFYDRLLIVGAEFNLKNGIRTINAMYGRRARHGAPISLNLATNSVLKARMGNDYDILATNKPLPIIGTKKTTRSTIDINGDDFAMIMSLILPFGLIILMGTFLKFPHMERVSDMKQLQLMCGVRPVCYWLVCYLFDLILYCIAVAVIIIGIQEYGEKDTKVFRGREEIGTLSVILCAFGLTAIPYTYLFTYRKTAAMSFICFFGVSVFTAAVTYWLQIKIDDDDNVVIEIIPAVFVIPFSGLTTILGFNFAKKAANNYIWDHSTNNERQWQCEDKNRSIEFSCCNPNSVGCLERRSYLSQDSTYMHLLIMTLSSLLYFLILLFWESYFSQQLWEGFWLCIFSAPKNRRLLDEHEREDVVIETNRIAEIMRKEKRQQNTPREGELLLVHQLQKRFRRHQAVNRVSFAVKSGECFGLLGVNGAGKSCTLRLLTGGLPVIDGDARILTPAKERIFLSKQHRKYFQQVGYCPQFDTLSDDLTGRQLLRIFAQLRGISDGAEKEINMLIQILGLEEYANKRCGKYSGGNKRKLNVAIALLGSPPLLMLDEPTSGIDPVSRRKLWNTITAIQQQDVKPSIILCSHSMEECEALCNNLAIMKDGRLECNGTIPNIKKKYAQGFTVLLKLKTHGGGENQPTSSASPTSAENSVDLQNLMTDMETKYAGYCTLKDKHSGLLHYHITDKNKKWGQIFSEIDTLQKKHTIIEDYTISETTLEQVFLTIARQN